MTREELTQRSEQAIREMLRESLPASARVYLLGSRARRDHCWNSDYDLWVGADIDPAIVRRLQKRLEESFVPFRVDIVTTAQLTGCFSDEVRKDAVPWM